MREFGGTVNNGTITMSSCFRFSFFWVVFFVQIVLAQSVILVGLPDNDNIRQIQEKLETTAGKSKVVVFGRIKDLESVRITTPGAAIIAPGQYVEMIPDYRIVLCARHNGLVKEKFLVVTASRNLTRNNLPSQKTGIVDLVGREKLNRFVAGMFDYEPMVLKRTNRTEDLVTMLGMESVDVAIISAAKMGEFQSLTSQKLRIVMESTRMVPGLVLAVPVGVDYAQIKKAILSQTPEILRLMGVDAWEVQ